MRRTKDKAAIAAQPRKAAIAALPRQRAVVSSAAEASRLKLATEKLSARRDRDRLPLRIQTRRLVLRPPIRGDVPALVALADNKKIAEFLAGLPSPYTRADGVAFVEIFAQRADERPYAIIIEGNLVGIVGLTFHAGKPPELGYWLGERHWGQGIMSEAVAALLEAASGTGAFEVIVARARADNAASLRVLEKAGFKRNGDVPEDGDSGPGRSTVALLKTLRR